MENDLVPIRRLVLLTVALAVVALGLLPGAAMGAGPAASPSSIGFGTETVGKTSGARTVTVSNAGPGLAALGDVAVVGPDAGDFSIIGDGCADEGLAEGGSCAVEVAFAPGAGGSRSATLEVAVDGEGAIEVPLAGTGQTMRLTVPASVSFPMATLGEATTEAIPLKNESETGVSVSEVKIEGPDAADFGIEGTNCVGFIGPNMGCVLTVRSSPSAVGQLQATLRVLTDGSPSGYAVTMTGEGLMPEIVFEPGGYDFGLVEAHSGGPRASFTVRNAGPTAVQLGNVEITGPGGYEFWIPGNGCAGTTLAAGATCSVEVQFNANGEGSFTAALRVAAGSASFEAPLTARAERPRITVSPTPLDFGAATVGSVQTRELTLTNTGHLPVAFYIALVSGGDIASFHLLDENCTSNVFAGAPRIFEPGESCVARIAFEPKAAGAKAVTVSFFGGGEGAMQTTVAGTAVPAQAGLSPSARDFGSVAVGTAGPTQTFQLRNESGSPQAIESAVLAGPDLGEFQIRADECAEAVLPSGGSCAVSVRFAPGASGPKAATLRLRGPGLATVADLTGEGTPPATAVLTQATASVPRGYVALELKPRPRPAGAGVTLGRARCASSEPCVVRLTGFVSGHTSRGLRASSLRLAPGASAAVTTALPRELRTPSARATLRISLRWRTGEERGAADRSIRLGTSAKR